MDRKFVWKLWTVGILSVLIMLGLGYLTYLNKHPGGTPAPTAAVSTPTPAVTASVLTVSLLKVTTPSIPLRMPPAA